MNTFPKATPVPRGCGERKSGGVYAECGLSAHGLPLDSFLVDPPQPPPEGLDIVNKTQIWQAQGGTCHLLIWVGESHYAYVADYIEETRRFGASRKLNPNLDFSRLTPGESKMVLVHPRVINMNWDTQTPVEQCRKEVPGHADRTEMTNTPSEGPCLYKTYELIPEEAGENITPDGEDLVMCLRSFASTTYMYHPTGEDASGLAPGIFAILPLHGFALIKDSDGAVNKRAKMVLEEHEIPFYESDK
jgi:hypothetical protein